MARFALLWPVLLALVLAEEACPKEGCPKPKDHWLLQKKFTHSKVEESPESKEEAQGDKVKVNQSETVQWWNCDKQFETLGRHGAEDMTECQGDCDHDSDCAPGLKCFQRRWDEDVPGCHGGTAYPVMDYCYNPACEGSGPSPGPPGLPELDSSYGSQGAANMPMCSGDCDSDEDCAGRLRCFQRDGTEPVPGCVGAGVEGFDYCYEPDTHSTTTTTTPPPPVSGVCLCVFDIDRTLTGKQGTAGNACPNNLEVHDITDYAYGPGPLTISDAGQNLQNTFCNQCYLGVVSAGSASGPDEKAYLLEHVLQSVPYSQIRSQEADATKWSWRSLDSPLVLGWADKKKQDAVEGIIAWYANHGVTIPAPQVPLDQNNAFKEVS